jgi:xanthine dehydrogenase YagS FAD-binding subunit
MNSFEYAAPANLADALDLLSDKWGETEILAGGTDLVTCLKQQITSPKTVVSLRKIDDLKGIRSDSDGLRIGAMTTLGELTVHAGVKKNFPALVQAAEYIGSPQILAVGTVGGDLCQRPRCWYFRNGFGLFGKSGDQSLVRNGDNRYHAIFGNEQQACFVSASSLGPALIALGATMTVTGKNNKNRKIAALEFFRTPASENERETALSPGEILTEIRVPLKGFKNATYEVRHRHGLDWPYVTASVAFGGTAGNNAEVVLGHVAPVPWRAQAAARDLQGPKIDDEIAGKCGATAAMGAKPLSGNAYKVPLVKTAVKRAILAAAGARPA